MTEGRHEWRGTLTRQYSARRFHALARASYFGKFSSAQPGSCDRCRDSYGGKTLVGAELGYRFNSVDLSVGARNIYKTYRDQPKSLALLDLSDPSAGTAKD